jgi:YD repeat-containing protein
VNYSYDANGNVTSKTDYRGIVTCYGTWNGSSCDGAGYDALNRVTKKSYSDNNPTTPTVTYSYDGSSCLGGTSPCYNIGRRTGMTDGAGSGAVLASPGSGSVTISGSPQSGTFNMCPGAPYSCWVTMPESGTVSITVNGVTSTTTVQSYDPMGRTTNYWQCTPLNCNTSSIWPTSYTYDLAGDVSGWTHPAGFTITQTLNTAQQVTAVTSSLSDSTHPATLATGPNGLIQYNAPGAITGLQNGCAVGSGSSCTNVQETYAYNNRPQMAMAELGTASSPAATSCRVYNYCLPSLSGGKPNPTSCAMPAQGTDNNGNVAGMYYSDSANSGLSHTASYNYDAVNRLISAAATGNSTYSQSYTYDPYGNMGCAASPAETKCLSTTYNNPNNNQISYITSNNVNTNFHYDAAGDLQNDGTYTYQ